CGVRRVHGAHRRRIACQRRGLCRYVPAMGRRCSTRIAPALLASLCACLLALAGGPTSGYAAAPTKPAKGKPHHRAAIPPSEVTLTPNLAAGGIAVTMPPVGLSVEYPTMAQDLGTASCPPPALTAELQRLGSPPLELAGVSQ